MANALALAPQPAPRPPQPAPRPPQPAPRPPPPPPRPALALCEQPEDGLTPRQREVLALRVTPLLAVELVRESPRGACVVCWRDLGVGTNRDREAYVCSRSGCTQWSSYYRAACRRAHRKAQASLVREVARASREGAQK
jgi:hypothetical protein